MNSAEEIGIKNVSEGNSLDYAGIRMADMFVGLISKLMQSLKTSLTNDYVNEKVEKTLLETGWFVLTDRQLLQRHFEIIQNKLPLEPIVDDSKDYFFNQRGAKVYKDITKQPALCIKEGHNQYTVLSVGFSNTGTPLVTISEDGVAY
ncbi:MAG: hypothetical protein K2M78_13585 [Lachnospiraceae bacterium]|nr:hypothetical protein [Lachnospiraceae bacterium]